MKRQCRIWLPKLLLALTDDSTHSLLFGWFVSHSSSCLDVVVAFTTDESSVSSNGGSNLQDVLHETNEKVRESVMSSIDGSFSWESDKLAP
ncbi:hypothetical protein Bca4012_038945 [Brassica carinata]|uniref:Uncharacterized protein n=1 Tax=Brassica carinata TaxID=52824 RepID=A0A8X7VKY3_BRACI|nr:hypothetical protein Bca52824_024337 [Brassica carinata]